MNIDYSLVNKTTHAGGDFWLVYKIENDGVSPISVPIVNLLDSRVDDYRWSVSGPGVTSAVAGTEMYGSGSVNDTLTIPAGITATFELTVITNAKRLPNGSSLVISTTINGTECASVGLVMTDHFEGRRGFVDINTLLAVFFGTRDTYSEATIMEIQDLLNRGLRFSHVLRDLADRRGYPSDTDAANRTHLGVSVDGVAERPFYGSHVTYSAAVDFDLTNIEFLTEGLGPEYGTNDIPGGLNGWGITPA